MNRADGIADATFNGFTTIFNSFYSGFNIAKVIESIEYPEYIDSHFHRLLDKPFDNIIGIMPVTHSVLPSQQHLERGVGHFFLENPGTFPGIFIEKPDAGVKGCPAPHFQGEKTNLVELFGDGKHILGPHSGREKGLVCIP